MREESEPIASALDGAAIPATECQPGVGWTPTSSPNTGLLYRENRPPVTAFKCQSCGYVFAIGEDIQCPAFRDGNDMPCRPGQYPAGPRVRCEGETLIVLCEACYRQGAAGLRPTSRPAVKILVPGDYAMADVEGLEASIKVEGKARPLRSRVRLWPDRMKLLGIRGRPGSGKTWICWAALKALASRGLSGEYRTWAGLHTLWHSSFNGQGRERLLQRTSAYRWLVLDDFSAAETERGWTEFVHALLDARFSAQLPTIVTMACDGKVVTRMYGEAIYSRLAALPWIVLDDVDRRQTDEGDNAEGEGEESRG